MDSVKQKTIISNGSVAISREIIDPSEDSGLSSISGGSNDIEVTVKKAKTKETIGDGIEFVNPNLILEEHRLQSEKIKRRDPEFLAQKRLAEEQYQREIQEQQYNRLMHLLSQSKALSNFILTKFDTGNKGKNKKATEKSKAKNEKDLLAEKLNKKLISENDSKKTAAKRGKRKLNLSDQDILQELASISDSEDENKENSKAKQKLLKLKYFEGDLRDYQQEGVHWLTVLYENGLNGILADEMGLGKTIQVIALICYLVQKQIAGPYMILVPLSTLGNWVSEFERFAPKIPVLVYYGNVSERLRLRHKIMQRVPVSETFKTPPVVIMTYQMPLFDAKFLKTFHWRYIVIDEAQRIKNYESQLFRILKSYDSVNRLLLTGTPLQNNLTELWSLLNFLLPDIFNNLQIFQSWFNAKEVQNEEGKKKFLQQEQEKHVVASLREILNPFLLRRLKEDVCPDIPPYKEVLVYAPLTSIQYDLYSAIIRRDIDKLYLKEKESLIIDIDGKRPKRRCTQRLNLNDYEYDMNTSRKSEVLENNSIDKSDLSMWTKFTDVTEENLQYLIRLRFGNNTIMYRHVVNHPYLIHRPVDDCGLCKIDENLIRASGKLLVLDAMLKKLKSRGHKILIFSTMTMVLDILEDYLWMRNYQCVRLDGGVDHESRKESIEKFQTDPEIFIFLLTTKAGAVGLNLAAADTVILYDSDWNPQNDLQAMARCHRIGQTKPVAVYRLCTKGTIDEEIIKRANTKRFLEKAVISKENDIIGNEEGLLKLKKLLEDNTFKVADPKKEVYTETELDELLDRSDLLVPQTEEELIIANDS